MRWLPSLLLLATLPACVDVTVTCGSAADCAAGERCTNGACELEPPVASCGDRHLDPDEACDAGDQNGEPGSGCTTECTPACGDGVLDLLAEACDEGELNDDQRGACSTACVLTCGDGQLQGSRELCDPAIDDGAWCGPTCRRACDGGPVKACASAGLSAAVTADGALFTWGVNDQGQLGDASRGLQDPTPRRLLPGHVWGSVACGDGFVLALEQDGTAWSWGAAGEWLGRGGTPDPAPAPLAKNPWAQLSTSGKGVLGLDRSGAIYFWGIGHNGANGLRNDVGVNLQAPVVEKTGWTFVAAGPADTSFAIDAEGGLFAWGKNDRGQLGLGQTENQWTPTRLSAAGLPRFRAVAAGRSHTLALGADGSLWAFGDGASGQLGRPAAEGRALSPVPFAPGLTFSAVAAADGSSFGVTAGGELLVAGRNHGASQGILGLGASAGVEAPTRVGADDDLRVAAVAVGPNHALLSPPEFGLLVTGADPLAVLGPGMPALVPLPIGGLCGCASDDDCGGGGSCTAGSCSAPGRPKACGDGLLQAGRGERCDEGETNGTGAGHCDLSCAGVERCGDGAFDPGEECDPLVTPACTSACLVPRCGDGVVTAPESGDGGSCASCGLPWPRPGGQLAATTRRSAYVDPDGRLWVFGGDTVGTLGWRQDPELAPELTRPARAPLPEPILAVALTLDHSLVLERTGFLWSFGGNGAALGAGPPPASRYPPPRRIPSPPTFASIAAGATGSSLAVDRAGALWFFGKAASVGPVPLEDVQYAEQLPLTGIATAALGNDTAYALDTEGRVFVWGANNRGQLGLGALQEAALPTELTGLPPIARVVAGTSHALFLARDGRLFGSGDNVHGQLCRPPSGPGGSLMSASPVEIPWARPLLRVAAGAQSSLALDDSGAGFGCGRNSPGNPDAGNVLGIDDPTDQFAPAPIRAQGHHLVEVATSGYHSLFLDDAGRLLATGHGESGELGLGSVTQLDVPTVVPVPCE